MAITITGAGPARLKIHPGLAGAQSIDDFQFLSDERAGAISGDVRVEKGVDVATNNVYDVAEGAGVFLQNVERLCRSDLPRVTGRSEGGFAGRDEGRKSARGAVAVEDGLISDDDHHDQLPLGPRDDFCHLLLGSRNTGTINEDAKDHLEPDRLASSTDIHEATAVGRVYTDRGETGTLDGLHIC